VGIKRHVDHAQALRPEVRQAAVAQRLQRQRATADRRVDQAGRHRQEGGVAQQHAVDLVAQRPGGADRDFRADAGRLAGGDGNGGARSRRLAKWRS
jgi:hypothetical protein